MDLAGEVGRHFPNYLKTPAEYYEPLTTMEKNVFRLMAQGMSNDEIADRLGKKTGTVKFHSNNISGITGTEQTAGSQPGKRDRSVITKISDNFVNFLIRKK